MKAQAHQACGNAELNAAAGELAPSIISSDVHRLLLISIDNTKLVIGHQRARTPTCDR